MSVIMHTLRLALVITLAALAATWASSSYALAAPLPAATPALAPALGQPIPLSSGWEWRSDAADAGQRARWYRDLGSAGWSPTTVPSVYNAVPTPAGFAGSVWWYRTTFTPPNMAGLRGWALRFESVRRTSTVWLNGRKVGASTDGYTPFTLAAQGLVPGRPNHLVVRVDNRKPHGIREGWWNWGGIVRPVTLIPIGLVRVSDLGLAPTMSCKGGCHGRFTLMGTATSYAPTPVDARIDVTLAAPSGALTQVHTVLRQLAPGRATPVQWTFDVAGTPELWWPGNPQLYRAVTTTSIAGVTQQRNDQRVGLRSVRVSHGRLMLNGRELDLRGAAIQEDIPDHGVALTDQDMDTIVGELKALGANVTRAQYALNDRLLDKLDAAGILVWSQAPIYHSDLQLRTAAGRATALVTLRRSIVATRRHPSVIVNSVANELTPTPDSTPSTRAYEIAAAKLARKTDPTRPVALDILTYTGFPTQRTYYKFDVLGVNTYFGWYAGRTGHSTADLAALETYLRQARHRYRDQALVMTEFGAEATHHGPANVKGTYEFQSAYLKNVLGIASRLGFLDGAIYWTLREFAVKPDWTGGVAASVSPPSSIHHKGLISYDGQAKPAFTLAQKLFKQTPLFHPLP